MRIAEALSKMKLQPFATEADVEEALRLFQVSTLDAALSGTLSGERTLGHGLGLAEVPAWCPGGGQAVPQSLGACVASVRWPSISELLWCLAFPLHLPP